ncbi:type VI secretion system membrane subunit TssM [Trinickia sp. LjRoot230]|uniref:type VI secretion system membrane subunit TssM n=1 Tax=Trinickia sp. LjRoot230 TaxID=3342288 RepID=UPI003ECDAA69
MSTSDLPARLVRPLQRREALTFVGVCALCIFVWLAGPLLAFANYRPLDSAGARALTILALFVIWAAHIAWRSWRASRLNTRLLSRLSGNADDDPPASSPVQPQLDELRGRFDEAVALLKETRFRAHEPVRAGLSKWFDQMSRQYLYQLPWYVFIGAPGSGKTTALVNSGLGFPLAEQFGRAAIRGVGGTRHCDWWFTNDAVLIDTAGRYTTHESNRKEDEAEWKGFVALLKKYRARQPLNGAILTVSVADLLVASEVERTQHAMILRKRLQELRAQLGIEFPVYLLVTKADLLAGFTEYFSAFGRVERAQVWGFTFKLSESAAPGFALRAAFDQEYERLHRRLNDALPELLAAQSDARHRELAYLLPQQFADMQDLLGQFVSEVFSVSSFEPMPALRGVYLTSGTQEGTAFDRVMSGIKRYLKIEGVPAVAQAGATGRSFFLHALLQEHIFGEASLAGSNLRWLRRKHAIRVAGHVLLAVAFVVVLAAWVRSYERNRGYLDAVAARLLGVQAQIDRAKPGDGTNIAQLLPLLNALRELPEAQGLDLAHPPLGSRWGLFQGEKIADSTDSAYRRALDDVLLPAIARQMETALRDAPPEDNEYAYAALKAYLMLYDGAHYDPAFVQAVADLEMERSLSASLLPERRAELRAHLASLFGERIAASPFPMNERLVTSVRERLRQIPFAQRLYGGLVRTLRASSAAYDFNVAQAVGPDASFVFRRESGKSLRDGVPGLYTREGYRTVFCPRLPDAVNAYGSEEVWVLNLGASEVPTAADAAAWVSNIRQLFLNDFIRIWDGYLADVRLQRSTTLQQSVQIARVLSSQDSPLTRLSRALASETWLGDMSSSDARRGKEARAQDKIDEARGELAQIFSKGSDGDSRVAAEPSNPESIVDRHFAGLRALAPASDEKTEQAGTPLDAALKTIDALYAYLTATDDALRGGASPAQSDVPDRLRAEAGRMPTPFREMLVDVSNVATGNIAGVEQRDAARRAGADIGEFCRQAIAGRYPFARGLARDVAPADFAQLFAPGGTMDAFFQKNLAGLVDTASRPWRFINRTDDASASPLLASFEKAAAIRDAYFAGGVHTAQLKIEIKPLELDPSVSEMTLDVDGQILRYAHGPLTATAVQWPGTRGSGQVRLQMQDETGATHGFTTEGPWALHRLFDHAAISPGQGPEQMVATFAIDGKHVALQVTAGSVRNPLRLPQMESFACPTKS